MVWHLIKCTKIFFPRKDKVSTKHHIMWHADVHELCRSLLELEAMRWGTPPMRPACSACKFAQRWDSLSTLSPVCLLQGQIARRTISVQTEQAERGIQSHPTEHPPPPSLHPHFPISSTPSLFPRLSFPSFSVFIFVSRFISDAFIHFQYLYVWVSLPPSSSSLPPCVHPSLPFFVFSLALSLPIMLGFSYTSCLPLPFFFTLSIPLL